MAFSWHVKGVIIATDKLKYFGEHGKKKEVFC
jgi:hypothetical protein